MLNRLKRWLSSFRPALAARSHRPASDPWEAMASRPLSLDAMLAVANGRMTQQQVQVAVREGIRRYREAASSNPASLWAMSFVDPYDWAMDTPDFYPGFGSLGGWGVPWMLNNQGRGDVLPVYINEYGLKLIRDWSRKILAFNEFALNAVENRISYIVGKGFQYTVLPKKPGSERALGAESGAEPKGVAAKAQAVLDEFIARERWCEREQECVRRCDRDGEAILRFFHVGQGLAAVRFVEPECLTDQQSRGAETNYGIVTAPGDIEDVQGYQIVENPSAGTWTTNFIAARDVLHIKLNTDFDAKRGLPTLFPVRKNLERADKLLRNMSIMGQVQATFAVIRKHKRFSPSSVQAFQQNQTDVSATSPVSGRALSMQQFYPGSVIDSSDQTEYEFPSANIDASGLVAVLQAELRAIAARMVMPEWMLTVDASNGNFAGQLVGGAPSVEKFKRDQAFFARRFGDGEYGHAEVGGGQLAGAMWRVLAIAVEGGLLPAETLTLLEIQAEGPSITVVNKSAETIRARNLYEAGLLSAETWSKWEGLDRQQELALGAKPQAKPQPPSPSGNGGVPISAPPGSAMGAGVSESLTLLEASRRMMGPHMVFGKCYDRGERVPNAGCHRKHVADKKEHGHIRHVYNLVRGHDLSRRTLVADAIDKMKNKPKNEEFAAELLLGHLVGGGEHIGGTGRGKEGERRGADVAVPAVPAVADSKLHRRDTPVYNHKMETRGGQLEHYVVHGNVPYQVVFQLHSRAGVPPGIYVIPGIPEQTNVDLRSAFSVGSEDRQMQPKKIPIQKLSKGYGQPFLVHRLSATDLPTNKGGDYTWKNAANAILAEDKIISRKLGEIHQAMKKDNYAMLKRTDEIAGTDYARQFRLGARNPAVRQRLKQSVEETGMAEEFRAEGRADGFYQSALKFGKSQTEALQFARKESGLKDWTPRS